MNTWVEGLLYIVPTALFIMFIVVHIMCYGDPEHDKNWRKHK